MQSMSSPKSEIKVAVQNEKSYNEKKDNIQKAIDNLKHFIKGSFPTNSIQQHKMTSQQTKNHNLK